MDLTNTPITRVSCLNVENPENQADQFWAFLPKMQNLLHKTMNTKATCHKIDWPGSQNFQHLDN